MRIVKLSPQSLAFPSPEGALRDPNGLLAIGGDLTAPRLLAAYERGIFPWYSPGKRFCGGHPIRVRCCSRPSFISTAA
ncbi:putative leucyl/phenylalanyl-tRNA--protein transferase [Serratia marcescens]|nr:putative leucyl/phenylalanyl-tRNA--protein transferase [Serratia marcescens]